MKGVYYSMAPRDRSRVPTADLLAMCTPRLLPFSEGAAGSAAVAARAADEEGVAVLEHGVAYRVKLGEDLSTGLFLDQRPQRAWLRRHLRDGDRLLNCFAHAGGYSIGESLFVGDENRRVPRNTALYCLRSCLRRSLWSHLLCTPRACSLFASTLLSFLFCHPHWS